jgi:hypothetical protein
MIYSKQELLDKFVEIEVKNDDEFLIIRETLTRIGTPKDNNLFQQCHIFHKQGRYYIVHYRQMLAFNGRDVELKPEDWSKAKAVANMLVNWGLTKIIAKHHSTDWANDVTVSLTVVQAKDKDKWKLIPLYKIGQR